MTDSRRSIVLVVLLLALLFALDVCATHRVFTSRYPGANDFYSRWKGAQVYWAEGINPYSDEATLAIQQGIYGRPAWPEDDPGLFDYPFYTVFLLAPLAWLPYAWVEAIWLVVLEFALIGGVLLYISSLGWRLPGWSLALTALWAVVITQADIQNLMRSKEAIYSAISTLLESMGMEANNIEQLYLAGGFGNYLDIRSAITIGMLPDVSASKVQFVGNSSVLGAKMALFAKDAYEVARIIASRMTYFDLMSNNKYMEEYVSANFLPHTDIEKFPSVAEELMV